MIGEPPNHTTKLVYNTALGVVAAGTLFIAGVARLFVL